MDLPGSDGEHQLQKEFNTEYRALSFYNKNFLDYLNPSMQKYIARQEMVFIATSDLKGECDCSYRAGPPGFVRVLDQKTITYPEYRGNGVLASLGNIRENPHIGLIFMDFYQTTIGLHVNGKARIVSNDDLAGKEDLPDEIKQDTRVTGGRKPECWVWIEVEEAYIHCSKHIPLLKKQDKGIYWGTDAEILKGEGYFNVERRKRT